MEVEEFEEGLGVEGGDGPGHGRAERGDRQAHRRHRAQEPPVPEGVEEGRSVKATVEDQGGKDEGGEGRDA